jgi:methionine synthase / methylenetetrahydrofolate reductase(NADPH)
MSYGVDVIGVNCSGGPAQLLHILRMMKSAVPDGRFSVMPNAGFLKRWAGGSCIQPDRNIFTIMPFLSGRPVRM